MAAPVAQIPANSAPQFVSTNGQHPAEAVFSGQFQPVQVQTIQPTQVGQAGLVTSVPQPTQSYLQKAEKMYTKHLVENVLTPIAAYSAAHPGVLTTDVMLQILSLPIPAKPKAAQAAPGEPQCDHYFTRAPNAGQRCIRKPVPGSTKCSTHNKANTKGAKTVPNVGPGFVSSGASPFAAAVRSMQHNGTSAVPAFVPTQITTVNPVFSQVPVQVAQVPQQVQTSLEAFEVEGQPGVYQETSRGLRYRNALDGQPEFFGKVNHLGQPVPLTDDDRAFVSARGFLLREEPLIQAQVAQVVQPGPAVIPGPAPPTLQVGGMNATPVITRLG